MSWNDPNTAGPNDASGNQSDWHEQPTQGPQGQAYGDAQPQGQYGQQQFQANGQQSYSQYGQQDPQAYGQYQQYGQPGFNQPMTVQPQLASWISRVGAHLIDGLLSLIPAALAIGGAFASGLHLEINQDEGTAAWKGVGGTALALLALAPLLALAVRLWNEGFRQGKTGQSIGKKALGISVVGEQTGHPLGTGRSIGRLLLDVLWNLPANVLPALVLIPLVNYLWPLWDKKNQTWSDKIVNSVVVKSPQA